LTHSDGVKRFFILWLALAFATAAACQSQQAADSAQEKLTQKAGTAAENQSPPTLAPSAQAVATAPENRSAALIPDNFSSYASEPAGNGGHCVVGSKTDKDGMNQRPVAYVTNGESKKAQWVEQLRLPTNTFQSRVTHCVWSGSTLFVLFQSDTQPEQTFSQTLLRVIKLDPITGEVQAKRDIQVAETFSTWVERGSSHFQWKNSTLTVSGPDLSRTPPRMQTTFTMRMDEELVPIPRTAFSSRLATPVTEVESPKPRHSLVLWSNFGL
jgi:hypothetical protein